MRWHAVIFEDDPARVSGMLRVLSDLLPTVTPAVFDAVPPLRSFIADHGHETVLISLDHDLTRPLLDPAACTDADRGDGRAACDLLAPLPPVCPVIVHSSNYCMASIMVHQLRRHDWPVSVVTPFSDVDYAWIETDWRAELQRLLHSGEINFTPAASAD